MAHPAWPRLVEGGRTARARQRSPLGAAGWGHSAELPTAPLPAALPAMLLLQLCYLPPKHGGAHGLAAHPGSSLLPAEGEDKPPPHLGLGAGVAQEAAGPGRRTTADVTGEREG